MAARWGGLLGGATLLAGGFWFAARGGEGAPAADLPVIRTDAQPGPQMRVSSAADSTIAVGPTEQPPTETPTLPATIDPTSAVPAPNPAGNGPAPRVAPPVVVPPVITPTPGPQPITDLPKYKDVQVLAMAADVVLPSGRTFKECVELPPTGQRWPFPVHLYYEGKGRWLVETHISEIQVHFVEATSSWEQGNFNPPNPACLAKP